ncbi:MAG: dihydrolipoyl dehydrogenase [Deltaproteobacteria bacterium]|jgi:dihydrolipoamide dehydrogenase|nr:dihydrolipoyl dehydrogenase [Deltaproteobacteria bacterium]
MSKKILIIGGGPGGYIAALRAAQLGGSVTLVEDRALGGTCLNRGCIPTKTLLHTVELYNEVTREGPKVGLKVQGASVDWPSLIARKEALTAQLAGGVGALLRARKVEVLKGRAVLTKPTEAKISLTGGGDKSVTFDAAILATGSEPAKPPVAGLDLPGVITSDEALSLTSPPKSLLIIGGGVIGIELASVYSPLGTKVTVVEFLPQILPNIDEELAAMMRARLEASGITILTGRSVKSVEKTPQGLKVKIDGADAPDLTAEKVLVATGRKPNTAGLGLEALGVKLEKGRIITDPTMATNVKNLYAVGDCSSPIMLAHVASREGEVAAGNILGHPTKMSYAKVPGAVYTNPEIAWVGLTEAQARKQGLNVAIGRFPLAFNGKCLVMGGEGIVKSVIDKKYNEILGVHILGPRASDLVGVPGLAISMEARAEDVADSIFAHPTVGEAIGESLLDALGRPLAKV